MSEKVEVYDTAKNLDKNDKIPDDAVARAKPSVLAKLEANMVKVKQIEKPKSSLSKPNKEKQSSI